MYRTISVYLFEIRHSIGRIFALGFYVHQRDDDSIKTAENGVQL